MEKIIREGSVRFSIITNSLLRIEEDIEKVFEDRPSTTVLNRSFGEVNAEIIRNHNNHILEIVTPSFHLYYDGGSLSPISLYVDIKKSSSLYHNRWFFGKKNGTKNLKGTVRTLDRADGEVPLEDGLMSKDGFSSLDDSTNFLYIKDSDSFVARRKGTVDLYLFCYGRDYQDELTDFYRLTGFPPMLPRFALGNWWSRFFPYTQDGYIELMRQFNKRLIPISVSVLDMDWHRRKIPQKYGSGWTGYSWNRDLFPNPKEFIDWLHTDGKKVALNVHPAAGIRAFEDQYKEVAKRLRLNVDTEEPATFDLEDETFRKVYFENIHHPLEREGVDFWWIDWQQGAAKTLDKMDPLWLLNYYHYEDNKKSHNGGLTLSRYAGPGSHRYPVGFSGDTVISWDSLSFQPYFTSTAANIGYTWWSHDIGGHMKGRFDGELATRWIQFGVFSPINRLHSSDNRFSGKEPWNYGRDFEEAQEYFLRLRAKLIPYIDTANYKTHAFGIPINRPLYYEWPEQEKAYQFKNEYLFGSEMIVSPITRPHDKVTQSSFSETWLPKGEWVDYFTHLVYKGNTVIKTYRNLDSFPVFVRKGSIIVTNQNYMSYADVLPDKINIEIFTGKDAAFDLYENSQGTMAKTSFNWNEVSQKLDIIVDDPHKIIPKTRTFSKTIYKFHIDDVFDEIDKRLKQAYTEFNLKQQIYDAFIDCDYEYGSFINLLNTVEDIDLRNSISEIAYIRESYNK